MATRTISKIYSGKIVKGRKQVSVRTELATAPLRCLDFFTPSFAWGYHGGAPDNLAISILQDHFGLPGTTVNQRVIRLFSAFSNDLVSNFGHDEAWSLTAGRIAKWVSDHEVAPAPSRVEAVMDSPFDAELETRFETPLEAELDPRHEAMVETAEYV